MRLTGVFILLAVVCSGEAQSLEGRWDGVITINERGIPFSMEFTGSNHNITGAFFNGDERVTSTAGRFTGDTLHLDFDHYARRLDARLNNGVLTGTYGNERSGVHNFELRPHQPTSVERAKAPDIGGLWDIPTDSPKGEHAWRLIVRQSGPEVSAAILRVDGDTGALTGTYKDSKFVLNHFDGARAYILEVVPQQDGTLALSLASARDEKKFTAVRPTEARAKGLSGPADPSQHTRVRNPEEPFAFRFPDVDGKMVSNTDSRFRGKVVLVNVTGTWCPNCHDEAPFLQELYGKYHSLGLEVVALDFEEPEQLQDLSRARAFIKKYGIEYSYLIAGEPKELEAKIPQAENLNAWPTTFILGRDGRVKAVHSGFAAPASGEFHENLKREFANTVERLLAEGT